MAFNINERMMATDRAIITRNRQISDLDRIDVYKFKPGMIHYVSEGQRLFLSTEPMKDENGKDKFFAEILSDATLNNKLCGYLPLAGGDNVAMTGILCSSITNAPPFKVASNELVRNLNSELLNGNRATKDNVASTILVRDENGNININNNIVFANNSIKSLDNGIGIYNNNSNLSCISSSGIKIGDSKATNSKIEAINNFSDSVGTLEFKSNVWKCGIENNTYEIVTKNDYGSGRGLDADTVDGKHVNNDINDNNTLWTAQKISNSFAPNGYGLGDSNCPIQYNFNNISNTGLYSGIQSQNGPDDGTNYSVILSMHSNAVYSQLSTYDNGDIYHRVKTNNKWGEWGKILTTKNMVKESTHVFLSKTSPQINNDNAFWFEIIS